jgi:hypothetical protein
MAHAIYFPVKNMSPDKFATVHEQLKAIGQDQPEGRSFHAGFHVEGEIQVFDVWESMAAFEAFGAHLMPILDQNGIVPGEPQISEIELIISAH